MGHYIWFELSLQYIFFCFVGCSVLLNNFFACRIIYVRIICRLVLSFAAVILYFTNCSSVGISFCFMNLAVCAGVGSNKILCYNLLKMLIPVCVLYNFYWILCLCWICIHIFGFEIIVSLNFTE